MDIEGAFDSALSIAITQAMIRHEIPETLVDWTENKLAGRNLIVFHGYKNVECTPGRGCPQGGRLSPLMWRLLVNDLLEDLQKESLHSYDYADDIAIVVSGHILTTLRDLMDNALKITHMMQDQWSNDQSTEAQYNDLHQEVHTNESVEPLRLEAK